MCVKQHVFISYGRIAGHMAEQTTYSCAALLQHVEVIEKSTAPE